MTASNRFSGRIGRFAEVIRSDIQPPFRTFMLVALSGKKICNYSWICRGSEDRASPEDISLARSVLPFMISEASGELLKLGF